MLTARATSYFRGDDLDAEHHDGGVEVRLIGAIVLAGFLASSLYHAAIVAFTARHWPSTTFLFRPSERFGDFLEVYTNVLSYGKGGSTNLVYSAPLHLFARGLAEMPEVVGWAGVTAVFIGALVCVVWYGVTARIGGRAVRDVYALVLCIVSYPVLFLVDRANLEMVIFVLLAAFVYLYYVRRSPWAWIPLSLAIAGKYYWVVLLVLFLSDRQWRQLLLAVGGAIVLTVASAVALAVQSGLGVGDVVASTFSTLGGYADASNTEWAVQHGHTLFGIVFFIDRSTDYWLQMHVRLTQLYPVLAIGVFLLVAARLLLYDLAAWRKLAALIICALVLPFENHDYTLVHLYLPLALLGAWGVQSARGRLYAVLFGLLLVPLDYVRFSIAVSFSSLLYPVFLMVLLVAVLTDGAKRREAPIWRRDAGGEAGA